MYASAIWNVPRTATIPQSSGRTSPSGSANGRQPRQAITFPVFHDPGGRATQAAWGTPRGPESYLLDASGRVVAAFPEPVDWMRDEHRLRVEGLLPSPPPGAW